jgi:AraC-like DNA-binding protein
MARALPTRGSTPARTWDTSRLPETEQFGFWQDAVRQAFVPVSLTRRQEGPFASAVTARTVGPLAVSTISSQAQSVERSADQVRRGAGGVFFLNMPLSGGSFASQSGRTARLSSGDFALVDSSRPFELGFEREFRQISVTVPHDCLAPLLAAPSEATGLRVPGDRGVGGVVAATLRALAASDGPIDQGTARALTDHIAGLIALAVGSAQPRVRSRGRALLLQAALVEVERSLSDPALSPVLVADRIGVSVRYLHRLFEDRGRSFGRWVLDRRLDRSERDLRDPARAHWTVADIAGHHGFSDPSYFARAFRARHGVSPREHRRTATERPSTVQPPPR